MEEKLARPKALTSGLVIVERFPPTYSDHLITSDAALKMCHCTRDQTLGNSFSIDDQILEFRSKRSIGRDGCGQASQMIRPAKSEACLLYEFSEATPRGVGKLGGLRVEELLEYITCFPGVFFNDLDRTKDIPLGRGISASLLKDDYTVSQFVTSFSAEQECSGIEESCDSCSNCPPFGGPHG
ncbi:MAG: hypothetical protein WDO73_21275 [Ignavibacteriota bacterium]